MKVSAKKIVKPYKRISTQSLQAVLRNHANARLPNISVKQLYDIMEELADRRKRFGKPFRSNAEAWADFVRHHMPKKPSRLIDVTGTPLTPSFHGEDCLGNGEHPGVECCCDECDYFLVCFPMDEDS